MVNFIMSMNLILLLFLFYNDKAYCFINKINKNNNKNEFLKAINSTEITNMFLKVNKNQAENIILKKLINIETNNNNNKNIQNKRLKEDLNLKETLKSDYLNLTLAEIDQLSFIETSLNSQESEFLNFKSKPFTWTNVSVTGKKPSPRKDYSVILADSYLVFFGGCTQDNDFYSDLYFYDILGQTWLEIMQKGKVPSARCGHVAKLYGSVMWIFGGYSREGHLNDLYSLNLETREWKQHYFNGDAPLARSNHGAVVDDSAKIYIFGGYSEKGYLNDLFYIDTLNERFEKVKFSGHAPSQRENFAMILINKRIFIFGGFQEGGVLNDIYTLDLITFIWDVLKPEGISPSPRQGMGVERFGKKIIISGGCDYRQHFCFADSFILDTETMWWSKIENDIPQIQKSGFDLVFYRGSIMAFGGCELAKNCTNNLLSLNVDEICPNDCSGNGSCLENIGCICKTGYISNDCSISIKCKNDCSKKGICHNNGKCGCFPGWFGSACESKINCPKNCTSFDNGVCLENGKCLCKQGFEGVDCSSYKIIGKQFDSLTKISFNEINSRKVDVFEGKKLNGTLAFDAVEKVRNEFSFFSKNNSAVKLSKANERSKIRKNYNANKTVVSKEEVKPLAVNTKQNESLIKKERKKSRKINNKEKPSPAEESEESDETKDDKDDETEEEDDKPKFYILNGVKYLPTTNCPNNCSKQGICLNKICLCEPGYTTDDCSITIRDYKNQGFKFDEIILFLIIVMMIAMTIKVIMITLEKSKKTYDDHLNLE